MSEPIAMIGARAEKLAKYAAWIATRTVGHDLAGECDEWSREMKRAFPELRRLYGWVECEKSPTWPHWYLVAPDGTIVDPTAAQFAWVGIYGEWSETIIEPSGVCPCGRFVYNFEECPICVPGISS